MSVASTLTEKAFTERRQQEWEELDALTHEVQRRGIKKLEPDAVLRMSPLYRSVCADLAAAQAARYSAPLVDYLLGLTAAAHTVVYGPHARGREDGRKGRVRARVARRVPARGAPVQAGDAARRGALLRTVRARVRPHAPRSRRSRSASCPRRC